MFEYNRLDRQTDRQTDRRAHNVIRSLFACNLIGINKPFSGGRFAPVCLVVFYYIKKFFRRFYL